MTARKRRALTRVTRAEVCAPALAAALMCGSVAIFAVLPSSTFALYLVLGAVMSAIVASSLWSAFVRKRAAGVLRGYQYMICMFCRYPLDALKDDAGVCPECGQVYTRKETERHWRAVYERQTVWSDR